MYGFDYTNPWPTWTAPTPPPQPQQVPQVTSRAGAEALAQRMAPNSSAVALHAEDDLMYVMSTDSNGVPRVTEWRIEEVQPPKPVDMGQFLTRAEFQAWLEGRE